MRNILPAVLILLFAPIGAGWATEGYWRDARDVREGVKLKELSFTEPRLMKAWVVRVDLKTPGIGFVTTERAEQWGRQMPDYTNGVATASCTSRPLHPRTAFGVSNDGRYLHVLVVDGRQPGYSLGASLVDLKDILLAAGASDVLNMDGGGSTSLVVFDPEARVPRMLNHHRNGGMRNVALNFGITFD